MLDGIVADCTKSKGQHGVEKQERAVIGFEAHHHCSGKKQCHHAFHNRDPGNFLSHIGRLAEGVLSARNAIFWRAYKSACFTHITLNHGDGVVQRQPHRNRHEGDKQAKEATLSRKCSGAVEGCLYVGGIVYADYGKQTEYGK